MPVCELCDGETFESRDGLYYCLTCGTQSQDIREEIAEESMQDVDPRLTIKKKKQKRTRGYERFPGKPWIMHEAFQIVIKKQVEFLIQIGVDAKIKDIVCQIWFKYLKLTGVAFCGKKNSVVPSVGYLKKGTVFKHNAQVLGRKLRKKKKRKPKLKKETETDDEFLELSSQISKEESHHGEPGDQKEESSSSDMDYESQSDESLDDDDYDDYDDTDDTDDEAVGSFAVDDRSYTRRMALRTTLAFSYLGLLYMNEPIFLSDILRWAREGHFPFFEASTLLPDYMKFRKQDSLAMNSRSLPSRYEVLHDAKYITNLLSLKLPEQDLRKYAARFIMDLNLPAITHGLVNNLLKHLPDKISKLKKQLHVDSLQFEEKAMSCIVIALKMCYGLDDSQHQVEEGLAKYLEASESRESLPVWRDWVSATRQCQAKSQASGVPWSHEELRHIRDPQTYTNFCKTHIYGSWAVRDPEMIPGRKSVLPPQKIGARKEYRDSCFEMFSSVSKDSSTTEQPVSTPTSFPNTCRHGNTSTNDTHDEDCFKDCLARRIPLEDLKHLYSATESQETEEAEREEGVSSSRRKYNLYLRHDVNGDTLHPSLRFLVSVMAKRIESETKYLEFVIMEVEDMMVSGLEKLHLVSKSKKHEEL